MTKAEKNITKAFDSAGVRYRKNDRSFVIDCPICDKVKGLYAWLSTGVGKCQKCSETFSPKKLLVELTGCTYRDASRILDLGSTISLDRELDPNILSLSGPETSFDSQKPVPYFSEPYNFYSIDSERAKPGVKYLLKRGVDLEIARKFKLKYCPATRRVVFPVYDSKGCLGWQARDVTGEAEFPYDSPSGFSKSRVLLGAQEPPEEHIIVVEGPFDFLAVAPLRGAVCSFGKSISQEQLKMIMDMPAKRVYLALDPDAYKLFSKYSAFFEPEKEVYLMQPPSNKEDFGDCTLEEVREAFKVAERYTKISMLPSGILTLRRV